MYKHKITISGSRLRYV